MAPEKLKFGTAPWEELLVLSARQLKVSLTSRMVGQFALYGDQLQRWNRKINLTAITNPGAVTLKHFVDSLAAAPLLAQGADILDWGSGAGFPGLCLKIVRPDLKVILIDAARKRIHFLKYLISRLGLSSIAAKQARIEDVAPDYPDYFDGIVSRAVTSLGELVRLSRPCLKPEGMLIAWKGRGYQVEIDALQEKAGQGGGIPGSWRCRAISYRLEALDLTRYLVIVQDQQRFRKSGRRQHGGL